MKQIAEWLQTLPDEERFIDLKEWESYVLLPNTKKSRPAQFKRLFEPYQNRISKRFLKDALSQGHYDYQMDKIDKIRYGLYRGEQLEMYQMYHIILLFVINKDSLNRLKIADLVKRITRFIVRSPTYVQRLLIDFKKWFNPQDYGVMEVENVVASNLVPLMNQVSNPEQPEELQAFENMVSSFYLSVEGWNQILIVPRADPLSRAQIDQHDMAMIEKKIKNGKKKLQGKKFFQMELKTRIMSIKNMKL